MKTTRITTSKDGATVITSRHSFGCGWVVAIVLLVYAIGSLPWLLIPTIVIIAAMVWAKSHQS
jgi:predicted metal-binding membrane protein